MTPEDKISSDEPCTWDLPPEPGPEVLAVRDGRRQLWIRDSHDWWKCGPYKNSWTLLFAYPPLLDASAEVSAAPAGEEVTP